MRYAIRQLLKSPVFAFVAIVTIALGIGANTAVFSVTNAVLLRRLPVPDSQRLVLLHLQNQPLSTTQNGYDDTSLTLPLFNAMRSRNDVFTDVVAFAPLSFAKVPVRIGPEPELVHGELVSGNYFSGLGVHPYLGRLFTEQDEQQSSPLAVLSHRWWEQRFGGSANVLGQTLYVRGLAFTIVGAAPPGFDGTDPGVPQMEFWIPFQKNPALNPWGQPGSDHTLYRSPNWLCLLILGRLRPEVSALQATAILTPLFRRTLLEAAPMGPKEKAPELALSDVRGIGILRDDYEHPLRVLMAMVALVLLIACANVAMLLILRNSAKSREFALRRALGASTRVLFAQLFTESIVLVTAGCALGGLFAGAATEALTRWSGVEFVITPDEQVLAFTIAISAMLAITFGLVPLRVASDAPLAVTLKSSAATSYSDRGRLRARKLVVALQIAVCAVLLFGGDLLYATLRNLESSDLGLRTAGVLVFGLTPESNVRTDAEAIRLHLRILAALRALPGVDHATVSSVRLGAEGSSNDGALVDGENPLPAKPIAPMRVNEAGSDFLHTLGIPLHSGRDFTEADMLGPNRVVMINQTFADGYLPKSSPLGHQIAFFSDAKTNYTIIGVTGNSRYTGMREPDRPTAYFPFTKIPGVSEMQYEVHTSGDPQAMLLEVTKVVHGIAPNLPLENPITQQEQFLRSISQERLVARLSVCFGALAMLLVLVGLYGTISYSVSRRNTEIGIRMALGAKRSEVLQMVLRESVSIALIGIAIGLPLAFALARLLQSMLFGLSAADPMACVAAVAGIGVVTACATLFPARRAASIDPMTALRNE